MLLKRNVALCIWEFTNLEHWGGNKVIERRRAVMFSQRKQYLFSFYKISFQSYSRYLILFAAIVQRVPIRKCTCKLIYNFLSAPEYYVFSLPLLLRIYGVATTTYAKLRSLTMRLFSEKGARSAFLDRATHVENRRTNRRDRRLA